VYVHVCLLVARAQHAVAERVELRRDAVVAAEGRPRLALLNMHMYTDAYAYMYTDIAAAGRPRVALLYMHMHGRSCAQHASISFTSAGDVSSRQSEPSASCGRLCCAMSAGSVRSTCSTPCHGFSPATTA